MRWRTAAILKRYFSISQPLIIRFRWNLVCRCEFWFKEWPLTKQTKFSKCQMADGRHIKSRFSAISKSLIVRLTRNLEWGNKITRWDMLRDQNSKFGLDGGRPLFWKCFCSIFEAVHHPIWMKFGVHMRSLIWELTHQQFYNSETPSRLCSR